MRLFVSSSTTAFERGFYAKMSKRKKRLQRIRQNPKNVSFEDLRKALEDYGFEMRGGKGTSHHFFRAKFRDEVFVITIPFKKPHVDEVYVKDVLKMIEQIEDMMNEENGDE